MRSERRSSATRTRAGDAQVGGREFGDKGAAVRFSSLLIACAMARLMCDVNMAEEAELWRLENGSPRSPSSTGLVGWDGVLPVPTVAAQMEVEVVDSSMFMPVVVFDEAVERAGLVPPQPHVPEPSSLPEASGGEVGTTEVRGAVIMLGDAGTRQRRGRVRANARLQPSDSSGESEFNQRNESLLAKGEYRRSKACHEVAPAGHADLESAPDFLRDFGGDESNADAFDAAMISFFDEHLDKGAVEERTIDTRDRQVGLFGDFLEVRGHGQYVKWVQEPTGWRLEAAGRRDGMAVEELTSRRGRAKGEGEDEQGGRAVEWGEGDDSGGALRRPFLRANFSKPRQKRQK
jgi:hypothetical protein